MGVEVDEITQLAVYNPFEETIAVLELDPEEGVAVVEGIYRVRDPEFEVI